MFGVPVADGAADAAVVAVGTTVGRRKAYPLETPLDSNSSANSSVAIIGQKSNRCAWPSKALQQRSGRVGENVRTAHTRLNAWESHGTQQEQALSLLFFVVMISKVQAEVLKPIVTHLTSLANRTDAGQPRLAISNVAGQRPFTLLHYNIILPDFGARWRKIKGGRVRAPEGYTHEPRSRVPGAQGKQGSEIG